MAQNISILLIQPHSTSIHWISDMATQAKAVALTIEVKQTVPEALERLDQKDIDIILLDLALTDANAVKTLNRLRARLSHTAIVALADRKNEAAGRQAVAAGAQDYLVQEDLTPRFLEWALRTAVARKREQDKLRRAEKHLELILESIKDFAIVSTDLSGHIDFWNRGAEDLLGYSEAEVINQPLAVIFTPEDRAKAVPRQEMYEASQFGMALNERWQVKKGGRLFYASGTMRPMYDEMQQPIGYTKVFRDLTERQLAQEQRDTLLQRALEARTEAEHANHLKEQLLATISHELRNPLASIVGFASMATSKTMTWPPETLVEFSRVIEEEAMKMSGLVEQLIDHARQRTGTLKIDLEATSIPETLGFAMTQLRSITAQHHLVLDVPMTLPDIYADPQRIAQVLTNLVGNAARYAPPHTQITMTAHVEGPYLQVDVKDEGPGIAPEQRQKVFEPFHQVDRTSTKGIGLGLALCKNLIERHQGQIWIQDYAGPGTIMSFTLPLMQDQV